MRALVFALVFSAHLAGQDPAEPVAAYTFSPAAVLNEARQGACLVGLGDGRAIAIGGEVAGEAVAAVELYSAETGWARVASMAVPRVEHTCTLLLDGRVMVAGGHNSKGSTGAIELYSVDSDSWARLSSSMLPRWRHTSTLLTDGRVLLAGGQSETRVAGTLEVFDPWFGSITPLTLSLRTPRTHHIAAPLPGGGALIAGGFNSSGYLRSVEIYNPAGRIDEGPEMPEGAADFSATLLLEGQVLIAGGKGSGGELANAQIYDPTANTLSTVDPLPAPRAGHIGILLEGNGRVLVVGGVVAEQPVAATWLFDSAARSWSQIGDAGGALPILAGAQTAPGSVLVLGETPQAMAVPAVRFEQKSYLNDQTVRIGFVNFGAAEASVRANTEQAPTVELERTVATGEGLVDFMQVTPETASRRWRLEISGAADGQTIRAAFLQKTRVSLSINPSPASPLAFENTTLAYLLNRENNSLAAWPPNLIFRISGTSDGAVASSFTTEFAGDQQAPSRGLAGGTYSIGARLASLTDLYELEQSVYRTDLTVRRRTPVALVGAPPSGSSALGELRTVSATVQTGLGSNVPAPSGVVSVSRGGYKRGEIPLRAGGTGTGSASIALGQAGSYPVEFEYVGDHNYEPISSVSSPITILKGNVILTLKPLKAEFAIGEKAWMDAVITHPKILGAAPTGAVVPVTVPRGAVAAPGVIGADPENTGTVTARVHAGSSAYGKYTATFGYAGDANFNPRTAASPTYSFDRSRPIMVLNPPATAAVGRSVSFEVIVQAQESIPDARPATGSIQVLVAGNMVRGFSLLPKGNAGAVMVEIGPFVSPGSYEYVIRYTGDLAYEEVDSPIVRIRVD